MPALSSGQRRQHGSRAQTEGTERGFEISVSYLLLFTFPSLFSRCDRRGSDGVRWTQLMRGSFCSQDYGIRLDAMRIGIHQEFKLRGSYRRPVA